MGQAGPRPARAAASAEGAPWGDTDREAVTRGPRRASQGGPGVAAGSPSQPRRRHARRRLGTLLLLKPPSVRHFVAEPLRPWDVLAPQNRETVFCLCAAVLLPRERAPRGANRAGHPDGPAPAPQGPCPESRPPRRLPLRGGLECPLRFVPRTRGTRASPAVPFLALRVQQTSPFLQEACPDCLSPGVWAEGSSLPCVLLTETSALPLTTLSLPLVACLFIHLSS